MLAKVAPPTNDFAALARYLVHGKHGTTPNPMRVAWMFTANLPNDPAVAMVTAWTLGLRWGFAAVIAAVFGARLVRDHLLAGKDRVRLTVSGGRVIDAAPGMTILDAIRSAGLPHASVCGGRGRCSTCRVRVSHGLADLPHAVLFSTRRFKQRGARYRAEAA